MKSGVMIVGKKYAAGGHDVFRVMYPDRLLVGCDGRHQLSIRSRRRVWIDHCEKVLTFECGIAGPGKEVMAGCFGLLLLRVQAGINGARYQGKGEQKTVCEGQFPRSVPLSFLLVAIGFVQSLLCHPFWNWLSTRGSRAAVLEVVS